jgi:hypothetical protein
MIRRAVSAVMVLGLIGCVHRPLGPYVSPRVTGQVIAADSGKALAGVKITRGQPERRPSMEQPKGGEVLMRKSPVTTDQDGRFSLGSERVLSIFRGSGWNQVQLTFERAGYEGLRTNCPTLSATNLLEGELTLDVGTVLLQPARKPMP